MDIVSTLGAGSGVDTKALIEQLVSADRAARTKPLTARSETLTARISALGQARSALQGIATSLASRVSSGVLGLIPATSDGAVIAVRRGNGPAAAFTSAISVTALAAGQRLVAAPLASAADPVGEGVLTIGFGVRTDLGGADFSFAASALAGLDVTITAANNSLSGLRDAINAASNAAGAGISAGIVSNAGAATLAIRGPDGAGRAFVISVAEDPASPGLARFDYGPSNRPLALTSAAADAALSLDGIAVTRSGNVIDDLFPGVRLQLQRSAAGVTLVAARDGSALEATVGDFASTLGAMRGLLADYRKTASGNDPAGALAGDATGRTIDQRMVALVTTPVAAANGLRLRDLGVSVARSGAISFDPDRLAALPPARAADAEVLLRTLSGSSPQSLQAVAALAAPASDGLARQRSALTADLARVEAQLAAYRTTLTRQYAAMDKLVAASKAVGAQLDTQIRMWTSDRG